MCGAGTVLLEASHVQPLAYYIGLDIDSSQISKAVANKAFYTATFSQPLYLDILQCSVEGENCYLDING